MAQGEADPERIEQIKKLLVIEHIENSENIKKPRFEWPAIEEAESYALYVSNELIYSGTQPIFPPDETFRYEEFAYGYYQAYLIVTLRDGTIVRSDSIEFVVGIKKPDLLSLTENTLTYQIRPQFRWSRVRGATAYEVYLDTDMVYEGDADSYTPDESIDFGRHTWTVVAKNEFQRVRSDRGTFQLIRIQPPVNISPENGYAVTVISEADVPTLTWRRVEVRAEGEITYELYVNGQKVYNGADTRWRPPTLLEPGLYEWNVKAKVYDQTSDSSETWQFTLREKLGMNVGVKGGGNLAKNTNPNARIRPQFTAGVYASQKIFRRKAFEFRAELNALVEMKSVGFDREDNWERQVEDLHINTFNVTIPLFLKPQYTLSGVTLYLMVGAQASIAIFARMTRHDNRYTEAVVDQVEDFGVDIVGAFGASYTFDVNYLFGQKLQLSAELRFNYGFRETLKPSFLGEAGNLLQWTLLVGNKIIDF